MLANIERQIVSQGFANLGDHYSMSRDGRNYTICEQGTGNQTMIEIAGVTHIRLLNSEERELLAKMAFVDRRRRLESVNVGGRTSLVLSMLLSETEDIVLADHIKEVEDILQDLEKKVS